MPTHDSAPIKVGIFVFTGVFLAMAIIFVLGSKKQLFTREYILVAYFEGISGLRVGAQVQLAGLGVGMVDRVALGEDLGDKKVQVRLSIDKQYQDRIRRDSIATIITQGLLGDKFIAISLGSPDQEVLKNGETLTSGERSSIDTIVEKGGAIMDTIDKVAKSVSNVLDEVQGGKGLLHTLVYEDKDRPVGADVAAMTSELKVASKELRQVLQKISKGEGTVGAFLQDPSLYYDIRRLFARVERNKILTHIIRSRVRDLELEEVPVRH